MPDIPQVTITCSTQPIEATPIRCSSGVAGTGPSCANLTRTDRPHHSGPTRTQRRPFRWENRRLRVGEVKRLFTLPGDFELIGSRSNVQAQLGNSVAAAGATSDRADLRGTCRST